MYAMGELPRVALGTWVLGGGRDWGGKDDAQSKSAVLEAIDSGLNFIDTAPIYGNYHAEELLGNILKGKRAQVILATKCGLIPGPRAVMRDLNPKTVRAEIEASLKRLQTDYIDIYFIHWPDRNTPLPDTLNEFTRLKREGKIKHIGVSNFNAELLKEAKIYADVEIVQNQYSYLNRAGGESVFDICKNSGIAFMGYGPLAGGVLSGKYTKEPNLPNCDVRSFFYKNYKGAKFEEAKKAADKFEEVAKKYNATAAQAAINWTLANPSVACTVAGARTPQQARDIAGALKWQLTKEDLDFLNESN
jgi:aryl-alcohol dehydrogenase-like predicted oxidoreductase